MPHFKAPKETIPSWYHTKGFAEDRRIRGPPLSPANRSILFKFYFKIVNLGIDLKLLLFT